MAAAQTSLLAAKWLPGLLSEQLLLQPRQASRLAYLGLEPP